MDAYFWCPYRCPFVSLELLLLLSYDREKDGHSEASCQLSYVRAVPEWSLGLPRP